MSERWDKKWGDFETVITSIEKHDQKYLFAMYQTNRWEIFDKLIELNKWVVIWFKVNNNFSEVSACLF